MITIGNIPGRIKGFFKPLENHFATKAWGHFWGLVLAMTIGHASTIGRLAKLLRGSTHRTNRGEFLWRSDWSESAVLQEIALKTLRRLHRKDAGTCYLILDETQTLKRAKKTSGVRRLYHHASGKYGTGHTLVKACLYYRGVTIPWATALCLSKQDARKEDEVFLTQTASAAFIIHNADLPRDLKVTVLFDSYYLCDVVADTERRKRLSEQRVTPPSCGNVPGSHRSDDPQRSPGDRYTTDAYRRAIARACDQAFPPPQPLARLDGETLIEWRKRLSKAEKAELAAWRRAHRWHPHQLRHNAATELRKGFNIETALIILGHHSAAVTEIYAEKDEQRAMDAIMRAG